MFSTPLISCSNGVATVRDTVSADAPGYDAVTCTVGGTISGYRAIGRIARAPRPKDITKMLSTVAKRGRSIKKWVSAWRVPPNLGLAQRRSGLRRPVARLLTPV